MPYDDRECAIDHPITINDAPVRCGLCGEPIIGTGTGTIRVLLERVCEHGSERGCDG